MDVQELQANTIVNSEILALADQEKTALQGNSLVQVGLYQNNVSVNRNTLLGDLVECNFGDYGRIAISAWDGPYLDNLGNAFLLAPLSIFTCDGTSSNSVVGAFIVKANGGTTATATNAGDGAGGYDALFTITAGGTRYESPPLVHLTGATGAGARAHAVITNGAVTDIVLDDAGSGYTTFVVVIDPPQSLVCAGPFPAPIPMGAATDALPHVPEIAIPPITNT